MTMKRSRRRRSRDVYSGIPFSGGIGAPMPRGPVRHSYAFKAFEKGPQGWRTKVGQGPWER